MRRLRSMIEKYAWAEPLSLERVWCVSVINGSTGDDVVRIFGGDPERSAGTMTFVEAEETVRSLASDFGEFFLFQVVTHGRYVVAIENNGYTGSVPEIARRASVNGGHYFTFQRNWTTSTLVEAKNGSVTAFFEPLFANEPPQVGDVYPDWISGVSFGTDTLWATCFGLLEQQTGLAFDRAWLEEKLPTYRIPDPDAMLKDVENARLP